MIILCFIERHKNRMRRFQASSRFRGLGEEVRMREEEEEGETGFGVRCRFKEGGFEIKPSLIN